VALNNTLLQALTVRNVVERPECSGAVMEDFAMNGAQKLYRVGCMGKEEALRFVS